MFSYRRIIFGLILGVFLVLSGCTTSIDRIQTNSTHVLIEQYDDRSNLVDSWISPKETVIYYYHNNTIKFLDPNSGNVVTKKGSFKLTEYTVK